MSSQDRFSLAGKVVLLTGGAGLYGSGLSRDLASAGAHLIVASRNLENCERTAAGLREEGLAARAMQYD